MSIKNCVLAVLAGSCVASMASADVTLRLVNTQDLSSLCDSVGNPNFYIGNNPSVCTLHGSDLFVAGYKNQGATTGVAATCQMVKIENIYGSRAFRTIPSSQVSPPTFRGFYGLQYDFGPAHKGLVLSYDAGSIGIAGSFKLYDVDTQLNPILSVTSPAGLTPRGGAGPAFDYGAAGTGFNGSPVLAVLDFAGYTNSVQSRGPFGITPDGTFGLDVIQGRVYDADSVNGNGDSVAPRINGGGLSGTLWRDISIDPRNGNLAARASNDVVIARRNANNGVASKVVVSCPTGTACDDTPFTILQRCELVYGAPGGDFVVYNKYAIGASDLTGWVKGANLDGQEVAISFQNADGSTFSAPNGSGTFDFSWDAPNGKLAVCNFDGRRVYIFEFVTGPTCPPCAADYNQDGGVDGADIGAFFPDWESAASCADINQDGGVDGADIEAFFAVWQAGGC
jgi:hypothetical protein